MRRLGISEILEKVTQKKTRVERIEVLRQYDHPVLRSILKHAFDPNIKFLLPEGKPPYKPCQYVDQEGMLYSEARRLYLFVEGGNPNLRPFKRELLFVQMLECLAPKDAELIVAVKDKKIPYRGVTPKLVLEAFPGLFELEDEKELQE